MRNKRRRSVLFAAGLLLGVLPTFGQATEALELQQPGRLRVAVYADFPPYSSKGKGIDVALGKELAKRLGLEAEVVEYTADEDMNDDLRNMVWKGHYLGTRPADVMLHVPVDQRLAQKNEQVKIFGPYHLETVAVVRNPERVPPVAGSAARGLEVFTREKIGVELGSLADDFLLSVLNGRLRDNVVHFRTVEQAVAALREDKVAAVMASRAEVEAAVGKASRYEISAVNLSELRIKGWALGMAVKADANGLADSLGKAMAELQRDGTVARIFAEHGVTLQTP
jgi:ABC-type amino acid transport substrate-binding protein